MRVSQEIRIIDLLALREAEFLTVRDCEEQIRKLLGVADFPFPPPPAVLPSEGRTNAKKAWRPQGLVVPRPAARNGGRREAALVNAALPSPDESAAKVPPLDSAHENAYRVHYQEKGKEATSFLTETPQVQSLLELACDSFRVTRVEAVDFRSLEDFEVIRTLWIAPEEPAAPSPLG